MSIFNVYQYCFFLSSHVMMTSTESDHACIYITYDVSYSIEVFGTTSKPLSGMEARTVSYYMAVRLMYLARGNKDTQYFSFSYVHIR